ncbi:hypothetical protein A5659_04240 [Mycobacterium sp. 1165196.3]|uniref:hypothetical protein n=1 Tax=unclassified Mycobacterium TaxID=2642494 RepID=UPI0008003B3A|nr:MULTISPECIES: hypothetical protein [unclassified Mycobacterium]OBJ11513.1 hypothetical protein A5624_13220 [Mycobacterium sp. 1482292.6]OBJ24735.1 hypothetical protein A5622_11380 [Mycobacterium sp. 1245801.1]OBK05677.1 hypothetical protein A9W96_14330 [Mycobacterium sp. 1245852.3]OBK29476.1 hypothetical protein A5659_04240 [Mycobacterium sp. 1165196.3]OBL16282.1 hypothetical protein A5646_06365 [Mycobacterium sp. 1245499.0]
MVAPTFDISKSSAAETTRANGEGLRYRLDVVAASAVDVVQSAGGWLYDRAMAGWEVTVLLPRGCDTRSLRILGVRAVDLEPELAGLGEGSTSLAVSAEAFTADARVRAVVLEALDNRLTEVALWGDGWPLGVARATTRAQHLLSGAARMFKGYALAAAGIPVTTVGATEALLCDVGSGSDSELIRLD